MKQVSGIFLTLFLALAVNISISCKSERKKYIPVKTEKLSQGLYDKYLNLLNDAYEANDNFKIAIQLANLSADKKITFDRLTTAINDSSAICEKLFEWYWVYDRHGFGMNLLTLDTIRFKQAVEHCNKEYKLRSFQSYAAFRDRSEHESEANKEIEDSTNFNLLLVRELEQIHKEDQAIRKKYLAKNITPELKEKLKKEMQFIDSINLMKIDRIFNKYGYPDRDLVGKGCNFTPALVIHHSKDLGTRYKYLPFLEKAVEDGLLYEGSLNMIKKRIEDMELDKKE